MHAVTLLNASAGTAAKLGGDDAPSRVRDALHRAGVDGEVRPIEPKCMSNAAREAAHAPTDAVVAGGGDGTVNCVATALLGAEKPMGVLPLGTLNHFAKDLGIGPMLEDAARALANGEVRAIDVGEVNGHIFLNNASIGLYPRMVDRRDWIRRRLGHSKFVAMVFASFGVFRRFPTVSVRIVTDDGKTIHRNTPFVFIGNNAYELKAFTVGGRASLDRGELGLYFANRTGRFAMVLLAIRALFGRLEQAKDFEAMTVREFWIDSRRKHLDVATDGEVLRLTPPLHFRSRHNELKVIAPPATPQDQPAPSKAVTAR
jgi:diacylglycerol kinase family enzyme